MVLHKKSNLNMCQQLLEKQMLFITCEKKNQLSPDCISFIRSMRQTVDGKHGAAVWYEGYSPCLPGVFSYRADWEGFLLCRCWIGQGMRRYLSTLWQGRGIREASTVLPWFPVQLCLPPTPRILVLCWPSVSHRSISGRAEDKQKKTLIQ